MNIYPCIQAVVEVEFYKHMALPLWEMSEIQPYHYHIQLSAQTTDREIGLIVAQIIHYNHLESQGDINDRLYKIVDCKEDDNGNEYLLLSGGLQICQGDSTISPGCCSDLRDWREWLAFLPTGESPWLGHDPSPWLELVNDKIVRIWWDNGNNQWKEPNFSIDMERELFKAELFKVQQDLTEFLVRLESWAKKLGFPEPERLSTKFDRYFSISQDWNTYNRSS